MNERKIEDYADIISLPYQPSKNHHHMSLNDRAAQFAPFAALNGYDEAIEEKGRLTEKKIVLNQEEKMKINEKLRFLLENIKDKEEIEIVYFVKDEKKDGGFYHSVKGILHKVDENNKEIILESKQKIKIQDIYDIKSEVFSLYEF